MRPRKNPRHCCSGVLCFWAEDQGIGPGSWLSAAKQFRLRRVIPEQIQEKSYSRDGIPGENRNRKHRDSGANGTRSHDVLHPVAKSLFVECGGAAKCERSELHSNCSSQHDHFLC